MKNWSVARINLLQNDFDIASVDWGIHDIEDQLIFLKYDIPEDAD